MKRGKKNVSYNIDENIIDRFRVISTINEVNMSEIVEELIRDYTIKHKAETNEILLRWVEKNKK